MRFLADMGVGRRAVLYLRDQGHDAIHLREQGLHRLSDEAIVEKACHEQRVILTHDLDFGRIVALSRALIPSIVTLRLTDMRSANVSRYLQEVIDRYSEPLERGALVSVTDQRIRVRQLPV